MSALRWLMVSVGVIFICVAVATGVQTARFDRTSLTAPGRVLALQEGSVGNSVDYYPVFSFFTVDGHETIVHASTGSNPPGFAVGQAVTVRYQPDRPRQARIATFWQEWLLTVIFGGLGVMLTGLGFVVLLLLPAG